MPSNRKGIRCRVWGYHDTHFCTFALSWEAERSISGKPQSSTILSNISSDNSHSRSSANYPPKHFPNWGYVPLIAKLDALDATSRWLSKLCHNDLTLYRPSLFLNRLKRLNYQYEYVCDLFMAEWLWANYNCCYLQDIYLIKFWIFPTTLEKVVRHGHPNLQGMHLYICDNKVNLHW